MIVLEICKRTFSLGLYDKGKAESNAEKMFTDVDQVKVTEESRIRLLIYAALFNKLF